MQLKLHSEMLNKHLIPEHLGGIPAPRNSLFFRQFPLLTHLKMKTNLCHASARGGIAIFF